ncbi:MAG: hypothetical protein ACD_79C00287G0009 [uncultured bacterium]|nr:MAG: hypothetical protein ACD_79C00287G0009 [uncultured bacterium]
MQQTKGRILFFYPNSEGYGGVPNGIALLSGCLKIAGFETRCFDTTFLNSNPKTLENRDKHGGAEKVDPNETWGKWDPDLAKKIPELLLKEIDIYKPDLIAVSHVDIGITFVAPLLKLIKENYNIPIVVGGITATTSPELIIQNDYVDMVCVGEGEEAIVELAKNIVNKKEYHLIKNIWVKNRGTVIKNPLRNMIDLNTIPDQDWSIFDERHYYKAYCGKFRRTGFFELARGCHFNCTYCTTATLRKMYKDLGHFIRLRDIDKTFDEICNINKKYNLELIFFIDDDFLGMSFERFDYFCKEYKKRINLPFYIQTRSETIKEDYIKRLKEINVSTIGIGVEHGNEEYRKKFLNRKMSNENLKKAFNLVHKYDIRTTANVIIGMPGETEKLFFDTVRLIQELNPKSISINYFQPFRGTKMREMAIEAGVIDKDHIIKESNTCLDLPSFPRERILHYYENFKKYVDGELLLEE